VVDLRDCKDRDLFEALLSKADIFVQNLKPGAIERIGYPVDSLCGANPRVIACSISGYGDVGPMAQRKAYDLLVQAESGLASITGGPSEAALSASPSSTSQLARSPRMLSWRRSTGEREPERALTCVCPCSMRSLNG
jgi:crotonobetainyl-CoA:carnitine CoA-transferase CaiB-like acyl-CoA transferase